MIFPAVPPSERKSVHGITVLSLIPFKNLVKNFVFFTRTRNHFEYFQQLIDVEVLGGPDIKHLKIYTVTAGLNFSTISSLLESK
jgi:hypothetical protein